MKALTRIIPLIVAGALSASASSLILENESVRAGVSDNGTFGWGSRTAPGIIYDRTSTADFVEAGRYDYLTPGSPWEIFAVSYSKSGTRTHKANNNTSPTSGMPTVISGGTSEIVAVTTEGNLEITQVYTLSSGAKAIIMDVTIKNTSDEALTDVKYARGIDPDQDALEFGTHYTENTRGVTLDDVAIAPSDIVYSLGVNSGLPLSLYSIDPIAHNTSVTASWSNNPDVITRGLNDGDGDYSIGMAFSLGTLAAGDERTFKLQYLFGNTLDEAVEVVKVADVKMGGECAQKQVRYSTIVGDGTVTKEVTLSNTGAFALKTLQLKITHNEEAHYSVVPAGEDACDIRDILAPGETCTMAVSYDTTEVASKIENSDVFYMGTYQDEAGKNVYVKEFCNILSRTYEDLSDVPTPVEPTEPEVSECAEGEIMGEAGCYVPTPPSEECEVASGDCEGFYDEMPR